MDLVAVDPLFNLYDADWPIRTLHRQLPPAKTVFAQEAARRPARHRARLDRLRRA